MSEAITQHVEQEAVRRMTRDLAAAAGSLSPSEVRFLVDEYYAMQKQRIRADNQRRAMVTAEQPEPHEVLLWYASQSGVLENQVKRALAKYSEAHPVGRWALSIRGIGPVIAAGLLAHIDIRKAPTVGHIWRFAGLDPTLEWGKGQKRPWNGRLKTLCWKIGESFVKTKGHDAAFYGDIFDQRKAYEIARNERGENREAAEATLAARPNHAQRAVYLEGKLPDGRIHLRAQRYAVKLFLAHLHEVWYLEEFGCAPPKPYVIAHLGHAHLIEVPNKPIR